MKAAVYTRYGPPGVIRVSDVPKPVPAGNEVLVAVRAAAVNPLDGIITGVPRSMRLMTGLGRPKRTRLGVDVAGEVTAAGRGVTRFAPGDEVFGFCVDHPDASGAAAWLHTLGAFAEYVCVPAAALAPKPGNITFAQAAAAPVAAVTALEGLRDHGRVRPGQQVLVNGASGGVGTFAVQIAKWLGAVVTGVCSTRNVGMVKAIGADRVIDYTRDSFTADPARYDLVFDCVGNHPLAACRRVLAPRGTYLGVGGPGSRWMIGLLARPLGMTVMSRFTAQTLRTFLARPASQDLAVVSDLMAAGKVTPVIDRRYRLDEVPAALRYLQEGHARGKVIIETGRA